MTVIEHTCPNGHPAAALITRPCPQCDGRVAYEPCSVGMALDRQLQGAVQERDEHRRVLQEALKGLRSEFRTARKLTAEQVERHLDRTGGR